MFNKARLKLTLWYLLIIMTISLAFSLAIFRISTNEFNRFETLQRRRVTRDFFDHSLIEDLERRLALNLIFLNGAIAVIAGSGAYFLASLTLKPIHEMMEEQNRFISDASHELRTPLTSLKTAMEVYLREKKKKISESEDLIRESILEVDKLQSLSSSLLTLSHQEYSKGVGLTIFNLKELIEEVTRKISPIAKEKKINIKTRVFDLQIKANRDLISEVMVILLDNAIKYSDSRKNIGVILGKHDGMVQIEVWDQGIGIKKEDLPHLFDRFYRGDTSRSKKSSGGFGLGLSIAKKIVDNHNGRIFVKSIENKGTTFIVNLPINL